MTKSAEFEVPLNVSGLPTIRNRGAFSWNSNGLIAVGSATDILIIDSESLSPVQVINSEHKSSINRVIWNPFARQLTDPKPCKYHADLITTDTLNNLLVWDVEKGQILSTFIHPESKQLLDIKWSIGPDTWKRTKIFLLYSSNLFVIYDVLNHHSFQNIQIFEPQGVDLTSFDSNPYSAGTSTTLAFLGEGYVSLAKFDPIKSDKILVTASIPLTKAGHYMPNNNGSPLSHGHGQPMSSHSHSDLTSSMSMSMSTSAQNPNLTLLSSIGKRQSSSASIRKLVSDIIVGPENPMNQIIVRFGTLEFLRSMKDHLIVWTSREIYLVNTHFHVILNVLSLEKSVTSIVNIIPCRTRPALFTLHENGTLFLRKYTINNGNSHHNHNLTISLDTTCANENPRFSSKKSEVLGGCLDPSENESRFTMYLSDGRFVSYTVGPGKLDKGLGKKSEASEPSKLLLPTPITPADPLTMNFNIDSTYATTGQTSTFTTTVQKSSSENISTVSGAKIKLSNLVKGILNLSENSASNSDPSVKLKLKRVTTSVGQVSCLKSMGKGTLFAGTSTGHVLMIKCGKGNNGIIGGAPKAPKIFKKYSLHSNSPVSGIELISDDEILTWANLSFSANPKCELCLTEVNVGGSKMLKQDEPSHIGAVRVSPLKQYFLIVYKNGSAPCELWDLPRRQLIKMLPSKLPPITCVQWKEATEGSKEETFFMTDLGTFLFTFRVDGNRFSNATCVKLDTGNMGGIPVALFTRGDLVFRGDSSGTLVIYNTDKKTASAGVNLGRGPLFKILEFTDYFIAQFSDQLELWDLNAVQKLRLLHSNKLKSTDISLVNDSFLAVLIKNSGGLKFLPVNTASSSAGDWYPTVRKEGSLLTNYPHYWTNREKCRGILEFVKIKEDGKSFGKIDPKDFLALVQKLSLEPDEVKFWSIVVHATSIKGKDWTSGDADIAPIDPDVFSVGRAYKEILVRIAQCVWIVDSKKREDVGRTLILSGESEKSAEILLDTDPSDAKNYIANGLKAAVSVGCKEMPEATKAVLKIVATNLIASGQHDEGLELLCMLHKHSEACKYIESANDWEKALLLCKTSLSEPPANVQGNETLSKYAQFLNTNRFVMKAASLFVYIQKYDRAVEVLFGARKRHLAYVLLHICEVNKYHIPVSDHIKLAIRLDFARFLFDMGLAKEAIGFCEALGDEGKDVKAELEILSS